MACNPKIIYNKAGDFFALSGHALMKLTRSAAIAVCEQAARQQLFVAGVEGGIWHNPGFEARLDSTWDYQGNDGQDDCIVQNNALAADFIKRQPALYDVFIITMGKHRSR
ncbi:hypothetical protein [Brucella pituitosa]|uniref:hypothetical protein n=1 Tax=Brucella pituitosa TaxID=571256 RepID=UPI0009A1E8F5|nr:hypothetical protein [Brucella pituitosa]